MGSKLMNREEARKQSKSGEQLVSRSGVGLTLVRKYLAMTPTERLRAWYSASRLAQELQKHAPRPPDHS
jgi:hypothetical protein